MATQYVQYPSQATSSLGAVDQGTPNSLANGWPVKITDGTDLALVTAAGALKVDGTGVTQDVNVVSSVLPTGASTAANQATGNASLASIDGKIVVADTGNVTVIASALPTGASTAANQTTGNASLASIDGKIVTVNTGSVTIVSSALPTGAATSALQTTGNSSLSSIDGKLNTLGQKAMAASAPVVLASDQSSIPVAATQAGTWTIGSSGKAKVNLIRNDYTSVNVTTAAYVQLVASAAAIINRLSVFDSSGQTLVLAVGAAASEIDQFYIFPGGNGDVDLNIPASSRLSVKAVSATASVGELVINCFS